MSYNKKYLISISSMIILAVIVIAIVITLPLILTAKKTMEHKLKIYK